MPKARKSNLAAPLGAVVLVLALVGAVFLLSAAWKTAASILDNSGKKKELEQLEYDEQLYGRSQIICKIHQSSGNL